MVMDRLPTREGMKVIRCSPRASQTKVEGYWCIDLLGKPRFTPLKLI